MEFIAHPVLNGKQLNLEADTVPEIESFAKAFKKALNVDIVKQIIQPESTKPQKVIGKSSLDSTSVEKVIEKPKGKPIHTASPLQEKNPLNNLRSRNSLLGNATILDKLQVSEASNNRDSDDDDSDVDEAESKPGPENTEDNKEQNIKEAVSPENTTPIKDMHLGMNGHPSSAIRPYTMPLDVPASLSKKEVGICFED